MAKKTTGGTPKGNGGNGTKCPLTQAQFGKGAKPLTVTINGVPLLVPVKLDFSSGSFGWYLNTKIAVEIDGQAVQVQVGGNFTVIGSKDAPRS